MTGGAPRVLVLGGGIAGLSAAWECHRQGVGAVVLEAQTRAGGVIRTDVVEDVVLDTGPDAFLVSKPGAMTLCRELGIEGRLIAMSPPRGAFVLRDGQLHALPEGGAFGIATRPGPFLRSTLLSPAGKLRVALEPLVPRRRTGGDESAGAFFRRRFGAEAAERIAQPLLGGIHAGDLDRLSVEAVLPQLAHVERDGRSVLLALRRQGQRATEGGAFRSFPNGMAFLVEALVDALPAGTVRLGVGATAIARAGHGWQVGTTTGDRLEADLLLLAAPAGVVAGWLGPVAPEAAGLASGIPYVSSAGVLAVYARTAIARPMHGSGYVSTPGPGREPLLATSWLSNKWAGRAPADRVVLRGFFGGAFDEAALAQSDETLVGIAHQTWQRRFGVEAPPLLTRVVRWTRTSPQHEVGHGARVRRIDEVLGALPSIAVCGSGFRAVGIPDVATDARAAIRTLLDRWRARGEG
ncbi:protoporphyrinogen oxidase [Luteitalea sp. TBR-22]|uniref:protoporphyrinogen oxidase n=1 Tax=Luteitalea sp. TBR-22 TaxID=2802971 RepID=UPI001AFCCE7A|nr:protoporphyrinogen oxidase [Luteitalea sp. TBR-22]BCS33727.1 protoporphyrinogen oxidase [Luteitalea sp. TBR-22]